jgi:6-pyruvoyltetrahydropterin/6-carboxytetrahydropterin synthase
VSVITRRRLFVGQDPHKFSVAHMTVFPDGSKEKLHGHNFSVTVALDLCEASLATLIDIGIIKKALEALCREWNEHLLVAENCPALEIVRRDGEVDFKLCGKRYALPADDVIFLPVDNIVVENLSAEIARRLIERLGPVLRPDVVSGLEVEVREAPGQGGSTYVTLS